MNNVQKIKPPQHILLNHSKSMFAQFFPADIHYKATLIHNGKELRVPICGAMSTIMTDDINQCTCKYCIGRFLTKLYDLKISMQQKDEGERENE